MDLFIKHFIDGKGDFYQKIKISQNIEKDPDTGFLYCKNAILGHAGKQAYNGYEVGITDKKVVYIERVVEDIFDEASLASYEGKPITMNHPQEMVDSKNASKYMVGFIQNVRRDGDNIVGDLVVQVQDAIDKIESGELKDLSLGYRAKLLDKGDGTLVQKEIVINHLALVKEGRAERAQILDEKTVEEETQSEDGNVVELQDKVHVDTYKTITNTVSTYDDETGESNSITTEVRESSHSHYEKYQDEVNQALLDNKKIESGDENKIMEKNFNYFIDEMKKLATLPKSEFRDKAFEALQTDCKEALGVELPALEVEKKVDVVANSVGLKDTQIQEDETPKVIIADAQAEEKYFDNLYRSFDNKENARKASSMTYRDVIKDLENKIKK